MLARSARFIVLALGLFLLVARAQDTKAFTAQPILVSNGDCITAPSSFDGTAVYVRGCDGTMSQKWDGVLKSMHIMEDGFILLVLSGTNSCIDVAAFHDIPGMYSCGGITGGMGKESVHQPFTYGLYGSGRGPYVFVPFSGFINNGRGPGQQCLTVVQGTLNVSLCDPAQASPEQQFFVGQIPSKAGGSPKKTGTALPPVAIAVPVAVFVVLVALVPVAWWRHMAKNRVADNARSVDPFLSTPLDAHSSSARLASKRDETRRAESLSTSQLSLSPTRARPMPSSPLASSSTSIPATQLQDTESSDHTQRPSRFATDPIGRSEASFQTHANSRSPTVYSAPSSFRVDSDTPLSPAIASTATATRFNIPALLSTNMNFDELASRISLADEPPVYSQSPPRYERNDHPNMDGNVLNRREGPGEADNSYNSNVRSGRPA